MDRDFLNDLFSEFGAVDLRRMFSGYGVSADGVNFALVIRDVLYFRADEESLSAFEQEGQSPFSYTQRTSGKEIIVRSYWRIPDRLYDDPEELAQWARKALGAARRAQTTKPTRNKKGVKGAPAAMKRIKASATSSSAPRKTKTSSKPAARSDTAPTSKRKPKS